MGLFSELGDTFLGGAEKKAAKEEQEGLLAGSRDLRDATATARADAMGLTQGALDANRGGFAAALDTWNRNMPRQAQTVQEGNRQAQIQRIAGMRQSHNALLGSPIDYSQIIPRNAPNNTNFIASLPTGPTVAEATSTGGVANDLANLPFEAKNIMGMLQEGRITTEEAHNWLSTGTGYSQFGGLPASVVERLLSPWQAGGASYSEATDPKFLDRPLYSDPNQV